MVKRKNMIRHVGIILAVFAAVFFLGACSSTPSPSETIDTFLKAMKSQDGEMMVDVYSGGEMDLLKAASNSDDETSEESSDTGLEAVYEEQMLPKMLDFDYEISNEQIDGDKATVDVKFTTYRIGDAFTAFFSDYISQAFVLAFSDVSEEELDSLATTLLSGKLADLTEKTYEKTVTISLTKIDDRWMVDKIQDGDDIIDALTGGLVSAFSNMEEAFSAWDEEE